MDVNNLKYVVAAKEGEPAVIRFFDSVNEWSCKNFIEEFLWLQDWVKPTKIVVLINSEGGSILNGMGVFSVIQNCPIKVDCIVEGIAASMATILWAAGDEMYMHDYSIVMIHNPFVYDKDSEDENVKNMIQAFKTQLSTIYQKRFGLSKDEVEAIMDGEGDADGTYLNAKEAVKRGIIANDHIIKTSKKVKDKVKNQIEGLTDSASIRDVMSSISAEFDVEQLVDVINIKPEQSTKPINKSMDQHFFGAVAAQLGFPVEAEVATVSARITDLLKAEEELKAVRNDLALLTNVKAELDDLKIQYAGKEAEVTNALSELESVKATLKGYQDAEQAALEAEIEATVQAAITAGKIDEAAKPMWLEMAKNNFEMVKATLASIHGRDKVTQKIADDPANAQAAQDALNEAQAEMEKKVKAVVGDMQLKSF